MEKNFLVYFRKKTEPSYMDELQEFATMQDALEFAKNMKKLGYITNCKYFNFDKYFSSKNFLDSIN